MKEGVLKEAAGHVGKDQIMGGPVDHPQIVHKRWEATGVTLSQGVTWSNLHFKKTGLHAEWNTDSEKKDKSKAKVNAMVWFWAVGDVPTSQIQK